MTTLPKNKTTMILGIIIAVVVIIAVALIGFQGYKLSNVANENEQLKLTNEQLQLANEFQSVNNEFEQY